ncbi:MAG: hypothetical protein SFV18_13385, partial [Bryobacteraceae bacterium]|nr:hypothetical protein [Bryobacteraceae bacterium]
GGVSLWLANKAKQLEPDLRERLIASLDARFDGEVNIDKLDIVGVPRVEVRVDGIKVHRRGDRYPVVVMKSLKFHADYLDLFGDIKHINLVRLEGFELTIPPKKDKPKSESEPPKSNTPNPASSVVIDQIVADNTMFRMVPKDPEKPLREFELYGLRLLGVGAAKPLTYHAKLKNYKPPGIVDATGTFGPWVPGEPGESDLSGTYTFTDADLGVFKGISGTLQSTGKFGGELGRIEAEGETRVPNFALKMANQEVPLTTKYKAVIDGTSGNTDLVPVDAMLNKSPFRVSGSVEGQKGIKGKDVRLAVKMTAARLEDFMRLCVKGNPPIVGALAYDGHIDIPRGEEQVVDKLGLDGTFVLNGARFTSAEIQDKIDELSRRGSGHPGDEEIDRVRSRMRGKFTLRDTVMRFSELHYEVPGASVDVIGTYGLKSEEIAFSGTFRMDATVSQTFRGMKSLMLKPFDGLFSRKGQGTVLSIKIEGTRSNPKFGLDAGRTFKKKDN